jgi:hypothetical protein
MRDKAAMDLASLLDGYRTTQFWIEGLMQEAMGSGGRTCAPLGRGPYGAGAHQPRGVACRLRGGPLRSSRDEPPIGTLA